MLGEAQIKVAYEGQQKQLSIVVASVANKPPIFGRDWLSEIRLNWEQMFHTVIHTSDLDKVMAKYPRVLKPGLGTMTVDGHLYVKPGTKPRFKKPEVCHTPSVLSWKRSISSYRLKEY